MTEISQFQFLMVRLKAFSTLSKKRVVYISIPYGAIKRQLELVRLKVVYSISIPYGAIKRTLDLSKIKLF